MVEMVIFPAAAHLPPTHPPTTTPPGSSPWGRTTCPPELLTSYHDNDYYKEHPILDRRQTLQEDSINPHNGIVIEKFMGALL